MTDNRSNSTSGQPGRPGGEPHGKQGGSGGQGGTGGQGGEPSGTGGQGGPGGTGGASSHDHKGGFTNMVDWITRVVGTLSFVLFAVFYFADREQDECQDRVNQALTVRGQNLDQAVREEREAERRSDDALSALVTALLTQPPVDATERLRLFRALDDSLVMQHSARSEADAIRKQNPPVPEADKTCR